MNQIERLKKNWVAWGGLSLEDRAMFKSVNKKRYIVMAQLGEWNKTLSPDGEFCDTVVYRLRHNYHPEPDKPVFEGYELKEVVPDPNQGGNWVGFWKNSQFHPLDYAPRFGCCGYVPKEKLDGKYIMVAYQPIYISRGKTAKDGVFSDQLENYKPASLGWVCFRSKK